MFLWVLCVPDSLFDEPNEEITHSKPTITIHKKIKVSIDELEFHYGNITFKYPVIEVKTELCLHIENIEIRPEFDVLKR